MVPSKLTRFRQTRQMVSNWIHATEMDTRRDSVSQDNSLALFVELCASLTLIRFIPAACGLELPRKGDATQKPLPRVRQRRKVFLQEVHANFC